MELQHVNVKVYVADSSKLNLADLNPVFQTWIQNKMTQDLLIDVADYLHVPEGPGMVLVGLEADYSMDNSENRLGLLYNRKAPVKGNNQARLAQAFRSALEACQRLEEDDRLSGKIKFRLDELKFFINDRALAPNHPETLEKCKPDLDEFFKRLFNNNDFELIPEKDSRTRFGVSVKTQNQTDIKTLLKNLN